ncbi:MAG: hypothetical protein HC790_12815 [Acaryochloridaceae cyanobacterium CSU_3_4]|nr:hypothetical protein [Acaryochloridaceae cyanobacterium CSU_3_4]
MGIDPRLGDLQRLHQPDRVRGVRPHARRGRGEPRGRVRQQHDLPAAGRQPLHGRHRARPRAAHAHPRRPAQVRPSHRSGDRRPRAERLLAAERGTEKIAVEVKSFTNPSAISEFHMAVGQYLNYRRALRSQEPARILYLAIPSQTYEEFFRLRFIQEGVIEYQLYLVVYDVEDRRIMQWIK